MTTNAVSTFRQASTRKEETLKIPGCLNFQDLSTLEPCHLTGLYIYFSKPSVDSRKGRRHKNSIHISSGKHRGCATHKFHLVSHVKYDKER